jgi:enoyl-CoA hydratase/carnithine racemase
MELEARVFVENTETADGREGIQAFVEKRKPSFQGR